MVWTPFRCAPSSTQVLMLRIHICQGINVLEDLKDLEGHDINTKRIYTYNTSLNIATWCQSAVLFAKIIVLILHCLFLPNSRNSNIGLCSLSLQGWLPSWVRWSCTHHRHIERLPPACVALPQGQSKLLDRPAIWKWRPKLFKHLCICNCLTTCTG